MDEYGDCLCGKVVFEGSCGFVLCVVELYIRQVLRAELLLSLLYILHFYSDPLLRRKAQDRYSPVHPYH